jgi:hypothetical protein
MISCGSRACLRMGTGHRKRNGQTQCCNDEMLRANGQRGGMVLRAGCEYWWKTNGPAGATQMVLRARRIAGELREELRANCGREELRASIAGEQRVLRASIGAKQPRERDYRGTGTESLARVAYESEDTIRNASACRERGCTWN